MKSIKYMGKELYLAIGKYSCNDRLYLSLVDRNNENFTDITINIPDYMLMNNDFVIINNDITTKLVDILEDLGILIDTYTVAFSGYGRYSVMIFNKTLAEDYIKIDYTKEVEYVE